MKWINHSKGPEADKINLLCFAYAGAGSGYFARWANYFRKEIHVLPVQYPLRDTRVGEPMPQSIEALAENLVRESQELFDYPYALFGHCMGAHVAYEVAHRVESYYGKIAEAVFLSSALSPRNVQMISTLDYEEEEFLRHYGVAEIVASWDVNFKNFFLPILRADSLLCENYQSIDVKQLSSKICLLHGTQDKELEPFEHFLDWKNYSFKETQKLSYQGDHFFIDREPQKVAKDIVAFLQSQESKDE